MPRVLSFDSKDKTIHGNYIRHLEGLLLGKEPLELECNAFFASLIFSFSLASPSISVTAERIRDKVDISSSSSH